MPILNQTTHYRSTTAIVTEVPAPPPPLDIWTGALLAYSFRKLRTAYGGSAVRMRRSSDSTEQDIGFDADGHFDKAAAASFLAGSTGFIVTWYDQSGSGIDVTQSTAGDQPTYQADGMGSRSRPCMSFPSSDYLITGTDAVAITAGSGMTTCATAICDYADNNGTVGRLFSTVGDGQTDDGNNSESGQLLSKTFNQSPGTVGYTQESSIRTASPYGVGTARVWLNAHGASGAGVNIWLYRNGAFVDDGGASTQPHHTTHNATFAVGARAVSPFTSTFWLGEISEIMFWLVNHHSNGNAEKISFNAQTYHGI